MSREKDNSFLTELQGCPNAIGVYSGYSDGKVFSGVIRCGSWTCPFCRVRKMKQLKKRMMEGEIAKQAISRHGAKFATLTFGGTDARKPFIIYEPAVKAVFPQQIQPKVTWEMNRYQPQSVKYFNRKTGQFVSGPRYDLSGMYDFMMSAFNKLRTALIKRFGKFMYFRVYEPHLDGVPHLHVLFIGDSIISKDFLTVMSSLWEKYGLGFVKLSTIRDKKGKPVKSFSDTKHAINYLLKYMTKDVKKAGRYRRVFSCSQNTLMRLEKKEWRKMKVIMGVIDDVGQGFVEEVVYDSDVHGNPAYEFENGLFGSEAELEASNRLRGTVVFDGADFVRLPTDTVDAIQENHIALLTQPTINKYRETFK